MCRAEIELTDADFEFTKPPLSKKYICFIFKKYQLDFIAYFGENMFYVSRQNSPPLPYIPVHDILKISNLYLISWHVRESAGSTGRRECSFGPQFQDFLLTGSKFILRK